MNAGQQWVAFTTILVKEVRRFMRIWQQTLLPPAITIALYFVIFGKLIGPRIGEMSGFTYIEFVVPGLIMMSVITNAYGNVVSSFFGTKFQRSIEELLVSPVPNYIILLGYVICGGDCDAAVPVFYRSAGQSSGCNGRHCVFNRSPVRAGGVYQRGFCQQL